MSLLKFFQFIKTYRHAYFVTLTCIKIKANWKKKDPVRPKITKKGSFVSVE